MSTAELVKAVENLPPRDFADFVSKVDLLRARRRAPALPADEIKLLRQINKGFSEKWWNRYYKLVEKRQQESLTDKQLQDLVRWTDAVEKQEARRMVALVKLASKRGQSLTQVMKGLGLLANDHG